MLYTEMQKDLYSLSALRCQESFNECTVYAVTCHVVDSKLLRCDAVYYTTNMVLCLARI